MPVELPRLEKWTFDTVLELVRAAEFEPGRFDYKSVLNGTGDVPNSIRRTAASMANSGGGFILFGVQDRAHQPAKPENRIVGIPLGGDLGKEFADKLRLVRPDVSFDSLPNPLTLPNDANKGIFVVEIYPSSLRPHILDGVFYKRGDGGSAQPMDVYEVREQMLFSEERLKKVNLLRLELQYLLGQVVDLRGPLRDDIYGTVDRLDASAIRPLLADICHLLPNDGLIENILQIPRNAVVTNAFLDRANVEDQYVSSSTPQRARAKTSYGELTDSNFDALEQLCRFVDQRLEVLFGPLYGQR